MIDMNSILKKIKITVQNKMNERQYKTGRNWHLHKLSDVGKH